MKRYLYGICISALVLIGLTLVSCDKETVTELAEVPQLTVGPAVTVSAEGGAFSFTYTVSNPASDGELICESDRSWISNVSVSGSGTVSFTVSANTAYEMRNGNVTVTYAYTGGHIEKTVGIVQSGQGSPSLTIQQSTVTADSQGGSYSFTYNLENQPSVGQFSCASESDWVGDYGFSSAGEVSFTVDENTGSDLRSCEITLTYTWSDGSVSKSVAVVQDHPHATEYDGTIESLYGTWLAEGYAHDSENGGNSYQTWTMTMYDGGLNTYGEKLVMVDGLVPWSVGTYPETEGYVAYATLSTAGQMVFISQLTGYYNISTGYYIGYTPCLGYTAGKGYAYNLTAGNSTKFTYNPSTGKWSSDYGVILALFAVDGWVNPTAMMAYYDATLPGVILTKVSDSTGATTASTNSVQGPFDPNNPVIRTIEGNPTVHHDGMFVDESFQPAD